MFNEKKILIITVNALDENTNNGKTFSSFFKNYPKSKIKQLYFHRDNPNTTVCDNFYRISDEDILLNVFSIKNNFGKETVNQEFGNSIINPRVTSKIRKSYFFKLLRSIMFLRLNLISGKVFKWIYEFQPDVIFFCGGDANFLYKKVIKLARKLKIPIINYVTDDYTRITFTFNIFYLINRIWTRLEFINISKKPFVKNFTIGPQMTNFYLKYYNIASKPLMNLMDISKYDPIQTISFTKMVYIGRFHSNRSQILKDLAFTISNNKLNFTIDIYSNYKLDKELTKIKNEYPFISFRGSIPGFKVIDTLKNFDILLHFEAFDKKSINVTYLSISTKIPEYFLAGRPILAIGPSQISSIKYLKENNAAIIVTNLNDLTNKLNQFSDTKYIYEITNNQYVTLKKHHDILRESISFYKFIESIFYE